MRPNGEAKCETNRASSIKEGRKEGREKGFAFDRVGQFLSTYSYSHSHSVYDQLALD